ncbi:putative BsuMI modification methylase subunit YdiP [Desulfuromonas versatilis]|uniref:Cytosine-specific methyltransferase n=1 Tax=Desulfuromonas versatilis TaxID=2802975 RepID=A0ABM8HNN5_9BACT|nr:DNA (cytosine-5-)-methyltransferase [Desulfuromonas versatilis]BCR03077.1 putative BsuMI modification methylase subunit YdiP [Desulfuromonas versatilis]
MKSVGLFAGIGGVELGFERAGIQCVHLCEINEGAAEVLKRGFPGVPLSYDVKKLTTIPDVDIVAGGFPCQNLSLVGDNKGIHGEKSGLVNDFFRLIESKRKKPTWIVLENVPFMLWQRKGEAMRYVIGLLEGLGYRWAYRVVDARAFGRPQRRRRVLFAASRTEDPRTVLFSDEAFADYDTDHGNSPCGFYWTEGRAGLGWAPNATPTLKGGSSVGIPSLPAIWFRRTGELATPHICDAERLQGFRAGWTDVEVNGKPIRLGFRCGMVGNAVSVPMAKWLGGRLVKPGTYESDRTMPQYDGGVWPNAAWGEKGKVFPVEITEYPKKYKYKGLEEFLKYPTKPLSERAASGFLKRARSGKLRFAEGFLEAVEAHIYESQEV